MQLAVLRRFCLTLYLSVPAGRAAEVAPRRLRGRGETRIGTSGADWSFVRRPDCLNHTRTHGQGSWEGNNMGNDCEWALSDHRSVIKREALSDEETRRDGTLTRQTTSGEWESANTPRETRPDFTRRPMCYLSSRTQLLTGCHTSIPDLLLPPRPADSSSHASPHPAAGFEHPALDPLHKGSPASRQLELVTAFRRVPPPGQGVPRLLLSARDACAHAPPRPEASSLQGRGGIGGAGAARAGDVEAGPQHQAAALDGLSFLQELEADLERVCGAMQRQRAQFACAKGIVAARTGARVVRGCGGGGSCGLLPPFSVRWPCPLSCA